MEVEKLTEVEIKGMVADEEVTEVEEQILGVVHKL